MFLFELGLYSYPQTLLDSILLNNLKSKNNDMDFNKDYSRYTSADFATDELFRAWVFSNDPQIHAFWKYWVLENSTKQKEILEAQNLLKTVQANQPVVSDSEINEGVENILTKINDGHDAKPVRIVPFRKYFLIGMAATFALLVVGGLWFLSTQNSKLKTFTEGVEIVETKQVQKQEEQTNKANTLNLIESVNKQRQPLTVNLPDGSIVSLEKGSRLKYPANFETDKREVFLEGEAFFEVTKNPLKPFLVHAQGVMTKVLGTSFRVKAFDKNVKVQVKTGKVAVFTQGTQKEMDSEKQAIVLTPNQEVVYESASNRFNKAIQELPVLLVTPTKMKELYFNDTPMPIVLNALAEAYGVEIIYDEDILHNCIITTSLTDEPLFEKLTIICKTMGATYRELDAKIIVTGRGCK